MALPANQLRIMPSSCCQGVDEFFTYRVASRELRRYRLKGPVASSRKLIGALLSEGVTGRTLLDIGGGIGAIQHELLHAGAAFAVSVDASVEYLRVAQQEAIRLGNRLRTTLHHGDFVDLADKVDSADIVALDRVLCCYADAENLIKASAAKARQLYGLVYPRKSVLSYLSIVFFNGFMRLTRNKFRTFYHHPNKIHDLVTALGLSKVYSANTLLWHIAVYKHASVLPDEPQS